LGYSEKKYLGSTAEAGTAEVIRAESIQRSWDAEEYRGFPRVPN
jgi:hypothetical protein